ncbi:MAG TPA: hypothetical protein VMS17_29045 [Gemmataceae bacterium]|nr:hypothetical protein [Gemmataceae bacterium]
MSEPPTDEPLGYDGRDVPADDSPVPAGPATVPGRPRLLQRPDHLILRMALGGPMLAVLIMAAVCALVVVAGAVICFVAALRGDFALVLVCLPTLVLPGVICWFWGRTILLPRVRFDKAMQTLTLGWWGLRGRRPLASVLGVQVMQTRKHFNPQFGVHFLTLYQMNLILDDPAERRLNVLTCDAETARSMARTVADFLGVPVLDSAPKPAAAAEAPAEKPAKAARVSAIFFPVVVEPSPDLLVLRTRWPLVFWGYGLSAPLVLVLFGLWGLHSLWGLPVVPGLPAVLPKLLSVFLVVTGLVCFIPLLMFLFLPPPQARFDRGRGELTLRGLGRRRPPRPLESVKTVEAVKHVEDVDNPQYRLNLLLDDSDEPRLTLIRDADFALVRRTAERLASFLGVPLLGAESLTPTAAQPGAGERAANPLELLDRSPLPAGSATVRGPARIVRKAADVLVLQRRSALSRLRWIPTLLITGFVLCILCLLWFGPAAWQAWLAWLALIGLLLMGSHLAWLVLHGLLKGLLSEVAALRYRNRFDRKAGLLKLGLFGLMGVRPLTNVWAVQLIPGGLVDTATGQFGVSYQVNLATADADQDRLNLTNDSDLKWTRQAGGQIADFLGVPLIDQIAED